MLISSADTAKRLAAATALADSSQSRAAKTCCSSASQPGAETDAEVRAQLQLALVGGASRASPGASGSACVFTGVSLGSILLLVALGLAITYGLMGVINMAHGELMMIGAYATYVVQNLFRALRCRARSTAYIAGRDPGGVPRRGAGRRGARAQRDPLALRPAARDAARHLGHQPGADAGGALDLRRAERAGREPGVAVGRRRR